ncbi:MAG: class II glutamine amidotransferase [Pseudomonadota bacterium]
MFNHPKTGLRAQSRTSREALQPRHPDGAGLVWYPHGQSRPRRFRTPLPAWRDPKIKQIAARTRAGVYLAHVRAATCTRRCLTNCHPFVAADSAFVHNGALTDLDVLAPALRALCPTAPRCPQTTDSELIFCLLRQFGVSDSPVGAFRQTVKVIDDAARTHAVDYRLRMSAAYTNGKQLVVVRYASDAQPPSLYINRVKHGITVASEPIRNRRGRWHALPVNSVSVIQRAGVQTLPFSPT